MPIWNIEQEKIVMNLQDNLLVNAPAGTGKTSVLAGRVAHIIQSGQAEASQILCLTFTNRACKELRERILSAVPDEGRHVTVKTIHSFCYSLLLDESHYQKDRPMDTIIYDDEDCKDLIRSIPECHLLSSRQLQEIQNSIEWEKKRRIIKDLPSYLPPSHSHQEQYGIDLMAIVNQYDSILSDNHALDFTDLITGAWTALCNDECRARWRKRYRFISIDEMQDTSDIEYRVISQIFGQSVILLCGDYFQTIYEWRGSHPDAILAAYRRDYRPVEICLTVNYRSTQILIEASQAVLTNLLGPRVQTVYPEGCRAAADEMGEPIVLHACTSVVEESHWIFHRLEKLHTIPYSRMAIMTRTNLESRKIWGTLSAYNASLPKERRIPVSLIDQFRLFKRKECKDVLAFLRFTLNPFDSISLRRIVKAYASRIGERTIEAIESPAYRRYGISLTDFVNPLAQQFGDPYKPLMDNWKKGNIVVFDVETTGTDTSCDDIIQISAIRLGPYGTYDETNMTDTTTFNRFVTSSRPVGSSYFVHHISDEDLRLRGEEPRLVFEEFLHFCGNAIIIGHNVLFDLSILRSERERLHMDAAEEPVFYDTLPLYRRFYPHEPQYTLSHLSAAFHIDHVPTHDSLDDIIATAGILNHIMEARILPEEEGRRGCLAMYLPLFAPFAAVLEKLRKESYEMRPCDVIASVMNDGGVKAYYERFNTIPDTNGGTGPVNRIQNIRTLYVLAREQDDRQMDGRSALREFLKMTSLSNSELDSLTTRTPQIPIITVHQSKGLEFDVVFLASMEDSVFPSYRAIQDAHLDEEKRLFYVALTRAKKRLFISWHSDRTHSCTPSRFINAIPERSAKMET